jgi:hypothetical protein
VRLRWKPAVAQVEQATEDDALEALEEQVREQLVRAASSPWQR